MLHSKKHCLNTLTNILRIQGHLMAVLDFSHEKHNSYCYIHFIVTWESLHSPKCRETEKYFPKLMTLEELNEVKLDQVEFLPKTTSAEILGNTWVTFPLSSQFHNRWIKCPLCTSICSVTLVLSCFVRAAAGDVKWFVEHCTSFLDCKIKKQKTQLLLQVKDEFFLKLLIKNSFFFVGPPLYHFQKVLPR